METTVRLLLAAALLLGSSCAAPEEPRGLNVLFLIADDLAPHALGCYGNQQCRTPAIDALAARGVRFTRAYAQFPSCGPSRASLLTGLYPATLGVTSNRNADDLTRNLGSRPTLPGLFKAAGWHSARVSKIFHMEVPTDIRAGGHGADHEASWSERYSFQSPEWKTAGKRQAMKPWGRRYSRDKYFANIFSMVRATGEGGAQVDSLAADQAIEIIEGREHSDEPFFLAVGFIRPHVPFVAPSDYFDAYPPQEIHLPERIENDWDDIPEIGIPVHSEGMNLTNDERKRRVIAGYYASVSFMDAQLGRILRALDERGIAEETLIVFTSDHGYHLGEHEFWGKGSLHEESTRVPLILAGPGIVPSETDALVQLIDLYPTLAELTGLPAPSHLQGTSLVPVLRDPGATVNEEIHSAASGGNLLRTDRWAYLSWVDGSEELYDMDSDPHQFTNLAGRPESGEILDEMRERLDRKLDTIGSGPDPGP